MKESMNRFMKKKRYRELVLGAFVFLVLAASLGWSLSGKGMEAETAADRPNVAPMEASISPVYMTKAIPKAQIVYTVAPFKDSMTFSGFKKVGLIAPTMMKIVIKNKMEENSLLFTKLLILLIYYFPPFSS
jgi:hypothetical protein